MFNNSLHTHGPPMPNYLTTYLHPTYLITYLCPTYPTIWFPIYLSTSLTYHLPKPNKINNVQKNKIPSCVNDYEKMVQFNINLAISKHFSIIGEWGSKKLT